MAILTKIRNRSGLAVGFVGLALALFVISDALNSNTAIFGGKGNSSTVGEIAGEKVGIKLFQQKYDEQEQIMKERNPNQAIDDNTRNQLRDQVWNQLLQDNLMAKEYKELGLSVSNEELEDMIYGDNINSNIIQSFTDPKTGAFDKNNVKRYLKQLNDNGDEKGKKQWKQYEDFLVQDAMSRKYSNIVKKGTYVTSIDAKNLYVSRTRTAELNLVALSYNQIADSTIAEDESDMKSYFRKNQNKYKEKENSRKLDFVVWDFAPTSEDSAIIRKWAFDQTEQFKLAKNDTAFVDNNGDSKFDPIAKPRSAYPEEVVGSLFSDSVGSVVGPIFKDGKYKIFKISGVKEDTVYYMHASHILFKVDGPTAEDTLKSKAKAEGILKNLKNGADFAAAASEFGTDGTKDKGGDLGWFAEGQMVPEFNKAVKEGAKGDLKLVKTQFGWHILKITDNKSKKLVCAGMLERAIEPSEQTLNHAYNDASQFASASTSADDFDKNVAERKLQKRVADYVRETDTYLPGYNDARSVVQWANTAKTGEVSEVFTVGDKYVIAVLKDIKEKDKASFESAKDRVSGDYKKDKKAEQLLEKIKTALEGATTLEAVSTKLNSPIIPTSSLNLENPNFANIGGDNTFAGTVFGSTAGKLLGPVKGDAAVYVYMVNKFNEAPTVKDFSQYKNEMENNFKQRMEYGYLEALKDLKGVKDFRFKFF
ncbi:MAG: SurA N-terminal domain-containing protein [Bacteroidetes bacterium]|nr:SurA N-terminal domain-containing protein [Bacteroidota bacterium]